MKINFLKTSVLILITFLSVSCSSDDNSSSSQTSTSTEVSNTFVKLTAVSSNGSLKSNYVIMMFDQPFSTNAPMPAIIKQVTTDANGLANFDLKTVITSTSDKTYYFEAFVASGNDYIYKSISHPTYELKKGSMVTSSIIVN